MFLFGMGYKGDLTNGENVEALQLQGYIPLQEDNDNVILPEGTYTISTSADNTDAFTLVAGGVDAQNGYQVPTSTTPTRVRASRKDTLSAKVP